MIDIQAEIKKILQEIAGRDVSTTSSFKDAGIDSLTVTELVIQTEEHLGIEYGQSDLTADNLASITAFIKLTEKIYVNQKSIR